MTLEELREYVEKEYPDYLHTFDWDEHPLEMKHGRK